MEFPQQLGLTHTDRLRALRSSTQVNQGPITFPAWPRVRGFTYSNTPKPPVHSIIGAREPNHQLNPSTKSFAAANQKSDSAACSMKGAAQEGSAAARPGTGRPDK
eukprot:478305-Amphidinium_carterae.2